MSAHVACPRCGRSLRPPNLMSSDWRCEEHGAVPPFHVPAHLNAEIVAAVRRQAGVPLWVPWPMPPGWTVTGVAWAGDERAPAVATALACSGPAPLGGVADVVLVAEEPGVGLGARYAGISGPDPGPLLTQEIDTTSAHAKVLAGGRPTPLWSITAGEGRSAYVGEALGRWLWAVAWPTEAGYVLAEHLVLQDLRDEAHRPLLFGAPSPYLRGA
jgi:hypothetical protein